MRGGLARADAGVPGATAAAQRTEMRGDDINMIRTYGHREISRKMGDRDRVVRFDSRIGIVGDLRSGAPDYWRFEVLGFGRSGFRVDGIESQ